ncbi:beta-glucuronidase [Pedobacter psychrophilus]|uniref:Beta-glucuronidase n=1 Tax=Pedobacter psychrophilus TaxID=1826909 RepID=A0A179DM87_9SPHI|nr:glycoside hydrolase family 2 TIM barrel-domain containing protein [Pedobacter psychrophilus]OAQ42018.1 beta-glucuronidase [Pedobacter psychrophilus]
MNFLKLNSIIKTVFLLFLVGLFKPVFSQDLTLVNNIDGRYKISLNGHWQILIDPYENGFYDYRLKESDNGYFKNAKPKTKQELIEYDFVKSDYLNVPGDWNSQREKLELYEGTVWYQKSFDYSVKKDKRLFLYFGACNYYSIVYINGKKLGEHEGGFTPFCFEVTGKVNEKENNIVVKVDNKRRADGVPTVNTDWYNYGGITRDVYLAETSENFIQDYKLNLEKGDFKAIHVSIKLNKEEVKNLKLSIPELKINQQIETKKNGEVSFTIESKPILWSPENPKLYDVYLINETDTLKDRIGFKTIETKGQDILLNGKSVFLKGISIHEEIPQREGRANGIEDAKLLLSWAKELGCNYVRLAHYPHNEAMLRMADELGLMVWSEIPVYWTIHYGDPKVLVKAKDQLNAMITQNINRASIIIWSMANETPVSEDRNNFIKSLCSYTRSLDNTRLLSAALEISHKDNNTNILDDVLGEYLDVLGCNEYLGWYEGKPEDALTKSWNTIYNKPMVISEFGAGALYGFHGDKDERFTEEYQENVYINQLKMLDKIPFLRGMSPWILADFKSPRRQLHGIQDGWNRKGLLSDKGLKKKAWFTLKKYYQIKK